MLLTDLQAVVEIERSSYQYPWSLRIFRDCLLAGYQTVVSDIAGTISGYGIMSVAADEAHLLNLCVHPACQRVGYGRLLLNTLLAQAAEADVGKVFLEVRPSNDIAIRLYRSTGFEQIGVRPSYYQGVGGREDAVIFAATLAAPR